MSRCGVAYWSRLLSVWFEKRVSAEMKRTVEESTRV